MRCKIVCVLRYIGALSYTYALGRCGKLAIVFVCVCVCDYPNEKIFSLCNFSDANRVHDAMRL